MHAWCSGRDVTFGEQCLIDEETHFPVWSDYRSQSEASTSPLSGSPICLTEFGVKKSSTERKGGGDTFWNIVITSTSDTCVSSGGHSFTELSFYLGDEQDMRSDGTIRGGQWWGPIYLSSAERRFCLIMTVMNALTSAIWYMSWLPLLRTKKEMHAIWN